MSANWASSENFSGGLSYNRKIEKRFILRNNDLASSEYAANVNTALKNPSVTAKKPSLICKKVVLVAKKRGKRICPIQSLF